MLTEPRVRTIVDVESRLNDGLGRTPAERETCIIWLSEYAEKNHLTLQQLDDLCFKDAAWVFDQIFG